jgi:RecB family endonuclease NucS
VKGKEFRNEVANWLKQKPNLEVIPHEYKIPRKGQAKDYGDIDVLAFDKKKKIIYCIECKNTKQYNTLEKLDHYLS